MSYILKNQAKKALWNRFKQISPQSIDPKGYLTEPSHNLLPDIRLEHFESEFDNGSRNELQKKFLAVHSSSALVVNTFAPFKDNPAELDLLDVRGFRSLKFEKKLPAGLGGTPPNVDLYVKYEADVVAVESKFLEYFSRKRPIFKKSYRKETLPEAEEALERFAESWDTKYPAISPSWRAEWERLTVFFDYSPEIRKVIYTTNAIESLNYSLRRTLKTRGSFPNDDSILKILYLAINRVAKKWTMPIRNWKAALNQFVILFGDRVPV